MQDESLLSPIIGSVCLTLLFSCISLKAEILLDSPSDGTTVTTVSPEIHEHLNLPKTERWATFHELENRKRLAKHRAAVPQSFTWKSTGGETGPFVLEISEKGDFPETSSVFIYHKEGTSGAEVSNFLLGKTYFWRVRGQKNGVAVHSKTRSFKSTSEAPRLMHVPGMTNMRDLGGWVTSDGKRVRQGMIYRSAALNANALVKRTKTSDPKSLSPGEPRIQEEGVRYVNDVLGLKTDLDLRSDFGVGSMTISPAGSRVQLIQNSSKSYAAIHTEEGMEITARSFRVFANPDNYPVDFHCSAGSSRAGCLAVVLNGVLGVPLDDLAKDWEITMSSGSTHDNRWHPLMEGFDRYGDSNVPFVEKWKNTSWKLVSPRRRSKSSAKSC